MNKRCLFSDVVGGDVDDDENSAEKLWSLLSREQALASARYIKQELAISYMYIHEAKIMNK